MGQTPEWQASAAERERAAFNFSTAINELIGANLDARSVVTTLGNSNQLREQQLLEQLAKLTITRSHGLDGSEGYVAQELTRLRQLRELPQDTDRSLYSECLSLVNVRHKQYCIVGKEIIGAEILNTHVEPDANDWHPSPESNKPPGINYYVSRFFSTDKEGRTVPVYRQRKIFYTLAIGGLVMCSEYPQLPNPTDYGDNRVGRLLLQQDTDAALEALSRDPTEASHIDIENLIEEVLPSYEVKKPHKSLLMLRADSFDISSGLI